MDSKILQPMGDRVVIRPCEPDEKTAKGLILPSEVVSEAQKGNERGYIVEISKEADLSECPIEIGNLVVFEKYAVDEVDFNGEKLLIVEVPDILAILNL